jgi:hypothetical protein
MTQAQHRVGGAGAKKDSMHDSINMEFIIKICEFWKGRK